jgi:hypothetical protein
MGHRILDNFLDRCHVKKERPTKIYFERIRRPGAGNPDL